MKRTFEVVYSKLTSKKRKWDGVLKWDGVRTARLLNDDGDVIDEAAVNSTKLVEGGELELQGHKVDIVAEQASEAPPPLAQQQQPVPAGKTRHRPFAAPKAPPKPPPLQQQPQPMPPPQQFQSQPMP